jgi:oligopeptide transport system substrate-binding protein
MFAPRKSLRLIGVMIVVIMLSALVFGVKAQEPKILVTGIDMTNGDPNSLDPQLAQDNKEITIINHLFIGLTSLDTLTAKTMPGLASGWEVSEDGLTYTFKLMQNVPWVRYNAESGQVEQIMDDSGNPRYVTANDVVYAWKRSLDPAQADPYAYVLAPYVSGGSAFNSGEGSADDVGITALDDYTVEVKAPVRAAFALTIYGLWMARPVPQWAIEDAGTAWTEPENIATFGPYAFKEWAHEESATLIKNPFWPGTEAVPQAKIDEVVIKFLDAETQLPEYEAGTMDATEVPPDQLERVKADPVMGPEYSVTPGNCTYYYGFNTQKPPFDNVHIRRAFSYAIDRQSIVDNVTKAGQIPARWLTVPGHAAAASLETNPDLGVSFDPNKAKEELQLGLTDLGLAGATDLPAMTLAFGNTPTHTKIAQAIQQMWADTLGVTVELAALDTTTYFVTQQQDAAQIHRTGWCSDYPDANSFLYDVMRSDSTQNYGHFANAEFDQLVDDAQVAVEPAKRAEDYARAEEILTVEDAGIAPLYWYVRSQLTKPYVERTKSLTGNENYATWDINK